MIDSQIEILLSVERMVANFDSNIDAIRDQLHDVFIDRNFGQQLIYADSGTKNARENRFLLFVIMLYESSNLMSDWVTSYHLLKEAYIMTDNIYAQLLNNPYQFDLKSYLQKMQQNLNITTMMDTEEQSFLNSLSFPLIVYRGMCNKEYDSHNYGVSWTDDKEVAKNYVFYKKNNNTEKDGKIVTDVVQRNKIFAAWGVKGKKKELIIIF